jgi:hypothetical protein
MFLQGSWEDITANGLFMSASLTAMGYFWFNTSITVTATLLSFAMQSPIVSSAPQALNGDTSVAPQRYSQSCLYNPNADQFISTEQTFCRMPLTSRSSVVNL